VLDEVRIRCRYRRRGNHVLEYHDGSETIR
jgi:hypothetical protein